jgi:hypothetical protein
VEKTVNTNSDGSLQVYIFDKQGYSLAGYAEKWFTPYGLEAMEVNDNATSAIDF